MFVICHNTISCPKPIGVSQTGDNVEAIIQDYLGYHVDVMIRDNQQRDRETDKLVAQAYVTRQGDGAVTEWFEIVTV